MKISTRDALHQSALDTGAFIKTDEVMKLMGIRRTTLHKRIADGSIPAPFKLPYADGSVGRANYWWREDIEAFLKKIRDTYVSIHPIVPIRDELFHAMARPLPSAAR